MCCIPEITLEYLRRMYDLLDLYQEPYDYRKPVIGIDEKPNQLIGDSRESIPMKKGKVEKYDYEYILRGKANIFMAVEPKGGRRITKVTKRRTKKDFAQYIRDLLLVYPYAKKLRIVVDNLNTHFEKSFYELFEKHECG